jgi:hypothetical protein
MRPRITVSVVSCQCFPKDATRFCFPSVVSISAFRCFSFLKRCLDLTVSLPLHFSFQRFSLSDFQFFSQCRSKLFPLFDFLVEGNSGVTFAFKILAL